MKKQKLLVESIRYITGRQDSVKIKGDQRELKAFQSVLNASRNLYESLHKSDANLKEIERLVAVKNTAAENFQKLTGQSWPL